MDIFRGGSWEPTAPRTAGLSGMDRVKAVRRTMAQAAPQVENPLVAAQQGVELAKRVAETMISNYSRLAATVGEDEAQKALDDAKEMLDAAEAALVEAQASVPMASETRV